MAVLRSLRPGRRQPERRRAAAVHPGPDNPRLPSTAVPPPQRLHGRLCPLRAAAHRPCAQLPSRYVKVNSAPTCASSCPIVLRAHRQRQSSPPVPRIGRAMHCNAFTFLPRPSDPLHRKQPQRSAPAHRTPRGSRQRAGIAARGLALPQRQQRDEVVDKWRQAQQPQPARPSAHGN